MQTNLQNQASSFRQALKQSTKQPISGTKTIPHTTPKSKLKAIAQETEINTANNTEIAPLEGLKTPQKAEIDKTLAFNALVQSQLTTATLIASNAELPSPDSLLQTLQPEKTQEATPLTDSPTTHAENQSSQSNDNQSEAFLSNDNDNHQQSANTQTPLSEESRLAPNLTTTSETSLPTADIQQLLQPTTVTSATGGEVSAKELASVVEQVGGKLEAVLTTGVGHKQVHIVLQPESLGRVSLQLQQGENQSVSGKIVVQTSEAFTALTQQLEGLKGRLEGQGITLQKLEIVLAPTTDSIVLDSQHHQAVLDVSNGFSFKEEGQSEAGSNHPQQEAEAFSMDKYKAFSGENAPKEEGGTANQQERKEAYQAHLNELRGLRSYRSAMRATTHSQYA